MSWRYLVALGSNMRVPGVGGPRRVIASAMAALELSGLSIEAASPTIATTPIGPSQRRYANAVVQVATAKSPDELLYLLQRVEAAFGRKRRGRRWRARPLDLDIVLWSGGTWHDERLTIPHPEFRARDFVLGPASTIAPRWRDPLAASRLIHLHARLTHKGALRR